MDMSEDRQLDRVHGKLLGVSKGARKDGKYVQKVHRVHVLEETGNEKLPFCGAEPEEEASELVDGLESAEKDHFNRCQGCQDEDAFELYVEKFRS